MRARSKLYRRPKLTEEMEVLNKDTGEIRKIVGYGDRTNFIVIDKVSGCELSAQELADCELML